MVRFGTRSSRLPDGRQVQKKLGPAWTRRGRPAAGYFTKALAQAWLDSTFADAAAEWLRYSEHDRAVKPGTLAGYRSIVNVLEREFGETRIEDFTPEFFETWKGQFAAKRNLSNRSVQRYLVALHSTFKRAMKVYGLPRNPLATVERPRLAKRAGIDVLSREEVMALVGAAASDQDGILYLTASFTGLRLGELLGLRWEDVDFDADTIRVRRNWTDGREGTPKNGRDRAVPLMGDVAAALLRLRGRDRFTGHQDLVFLRSPRPPPRLQVTEGPLQAGASGRRPPRAPLSRSPPHLRHARDPCGGSPRGHGVDGPRRHPDDAEVPRLQAAPRRGQATRRRVRGRLPRTDRLAGLQLCDDPPAALALPVGAS